MKYTGMVGFVLGDFLFAACMCINRKTRRLMLDVPKLWITGK